jgi:hypothetical protein
MSQRPFLSMESKLLLALKARLEKSCGSCTAMISALLDQRSAVHVKMFSEDW